MEKNEIFHPPLWTKYWKLSKYILWGCFSHESLASIKKWANLDLVTSAISPKLSYSNRKWLLIVSSIRNGSMNKFWTQKIALKNMKFTFCHFSTINKQWSCKFHWFLTATFGAENVLIPPFFRDHSQIKSSHSLHQIWMSEWV